MTGNDQSKLAHRKSVKEALASAKSWYGVFGVSAATVSLLNFIHGIFQLRLGETLRRIIQAYHEVVHGALDWLTAIFGWHIPGPIKDLIIIYFLVGGAFMRARSGEPMYGENPNASLRNVLKIMVWPERRMGLVVEPGSPGPSTNRRTPAAYRAAPPWLRRIFDFILWPRVAIQYWQSPMVYFNDYLGTFPSFKPGYRPGPYKVFLYDRRLIFTMHVLFVIGAVVVALVLNGFQTAWA